MIYQIKEDDQMIHQQLERFDFTNPPVDPWDLVTNLAETMRAGRGIGLAANQCGLPFRVFVMDGEQIYACFNPRIVDASETKVALEEGCLSFPDLIVKVRRPEKIRVRYEEPNGETVTATFTGMTARVFQHELDHLDGVTFLQRASTLERDKARQRRKQIRRRK